MRYRTIKEEIVYFDLPNTDGLKIKGIIRGTLKDSVAVLIHGRPGSGNELLQYLGARYLYERGISTLRLFMYDFDPNTRNLMDCNLQTHVDDFEIVVEKLRMQKVNKVFAVGHSYGGLTILKSNAKLDGAVLWDPSHGSWWAENRSALYETEFPEKELDKYVIGTAGPGWVYPAAGLEYDKHLGDTSGLAVKNYPLKIISAGRGALTDLGEKYYMVAKEPKSHIIIKGAGHGFEESDEIMLKLFKETANWFTTNCSV